MEKRKKNWTVIDIIRWGTDYFKEKDIDSPRLTIELLLCKILECERISLYTNFEKPLSDDELFRLKGFIKRRISREPLQFILGRTKFNDTELIINNSSIVPRPETELMVDYAINIIKNNSSIKDILDIGTGSGCIAISLARRYPDINFHAIDINIEALKLAEKNARYNGLKNIYFYQLDILKMTPTKKFDLIISNPPYVSQEEYKILEPEVLYYEPQEAITDNYDGLTFYRRFSEIFREILNHNGMFILEIAYNQSDEVLHIFNQQGYQVNFVKDWNNIKRVVIGKYDKF